MTDDYFNYDSYDSFLHRSYLSLFGVLSEFTVSYCARYILRQWTGGLWFCDASWLMTHDGANEQRDPKMRLRRTFDYGTLAYGLSSEDWSIYEASILFSSNTRPSLHTYVDSRPPSASLISSHSFFSNKTHKKTFFSPPSCRHPKQETIPITYLINVTILALAN